MHDGNPLPGAEPVKAEPPPYLFQFEYLAPSMNPVHGLGKLDLPAVNPTRTYADALQSGKQYDIIWVPAGKYIYHSLFDLIERKLIVDLFFSQPRAFARSQHRRR